MPDDVQLGNHSQARSKHHRPNGHPTFECVALLLQGRRRTLERQTSENP